MLWKKPRCVSDYHEWWEVGPPYYYNDIRITYSLIVLGGALLAGIFLFVYTFIDSTPHGMYGDDQAKKVHKFVTQ